MTDFEVAQSDFQTIVRLLQTAPETTLIEMLRHKRLVIAEEANNQLCQRFSDSEVTRNAISTALEDHNVHTFVLDIIRDDWDWLLD